MKKIVLMTVMGLFVAAPAFAEPGEHHGDKGPRHEKMMERMFEKNDTDKDGAISKEEFIKSSEERFASMDADGDGKVTKEEAKKHHEEKREKFLEMKEKKEAAADGAVDEAAPE